MRDPRAIIIAVLPAVVGLIAAAVYNRHSLAWGDVPTWLGTIATIGLFAGAALTVYYARKAFGQQAAELELLKDQAQRDIDERRRSQARLVYIESGGSLGDLYVRTDGSSDILIRADGSDYRSDEEPDPEGTELDPTIPARAIPMYFAWATLTNSSQQPIYDAAVSFSVPDSGFEISELMGLVMPGMPAEFRQSWSRDQGWVRVIVKAEFRDAAGVVWRLAENGYLTEVTGQSAFDRRLENLVGSEYLREHPRYP